MRAMGKTISKPRRKLAKLILALIPSAVIAFACEAVHVHPLQGMPLLDGIDGGSFEGGSAVTARGAGSAASFSAACSELEYEQLLLAEAEVRVSVRVS